MLAPGPADALLVVDESLPGSPLLPEVSPGLRDLAERVDREFP